MRLHFATTATLLLLVFGSPTTAQIATDKTQAPGIFRMRVGNFLVTALSDGTAAQDLHTVVTGAKRAEVDALLRRSFLSNPVEVSINAFLVDTGSRLILVDTGAGRLFGPGTGGKLVDALAAAGYRPDQIDDILITHVHTDHSGGLTDGARMVFPKAVVHVGQADLDFFLTTANAEKSGVDRHFFDEADMTIGPYVRAGKVKGFERRTPLFTGVTAIPTPGHTPGHAFYRFESRGQSIEFWGDVMHFGALQFQRPAITVTYDVDSPAAAAQRAKQFAAATSDRRLIAMAHMGFPGVGNIRVDTRGGYSWIPVEYSNRASALRTLPGK